MLTADGYAGSGRVDRADLHSDRSGVAKLFGERDILQPTLGAPIDR